MVYIHLTASYTQEEMMLQAKYDKLKRKKKALQILRTPRKEPERLTPVKKPQIEARDAREIAKKLIKSGAIPAIKKTQKREETSGFKRPGGVGNKVDKAVLSGYQPFAGNCDESRPCVKRLYEGMCKTDASAPVPQSKHEKIISRTVCVKGNGISENLIRKTFSDHGNIIGLSVNTVEGQAFVTFDNPQSAETCISALNGTVLNESQLFVNYTKSHSNDVDPPSQSSKKKFDKEVQNQRELVTYDDDFF